jgi:hypothetical protein
MVENLPIGNFDFIVIDSIVIDTIDLEVVGRGDCGQQDGQQHDGGFDKLFHNKKCLEINNG